MLAADGVRRSWACGDRGLGLLKTEIDFSECEVCVSLDTGDESCDGGPQNIQHIPKSCEHQTLILDSLCDSLSPKGQPYMLERATSESSNPSVRREEGS